MKKNLWKLWAYSILWLGLTPWPGWSGEIDLKVTTEPSGAKITFISLDRGITKSYYAPAKISYDPAICYDPTLTVELPGYAKKMIKVKTEAGDQEINIVLDKLTADQIEHEKNADIGVPDNLNEHIPDWMSEINKLTPAFDPAHQH